MNTQCTQRETEIQHIIMKNQFNTLDDQSKYPDISRMHSKTVIMENSEYGNAKPVRFLSNVSYLVLNMLQPFSSLLSLLCKRQPPKCLPPGKSLSKLSRTKSLPRRRPLSLLLKPLPSFSLAAKPAYPSAPGISSLFSLSSLSPSKYLLAAKAPFSQAFLSRLPPMPTKLTGLPLSSSLTSSLEITSLSKNISNGSTPDHLSYSLPDLPLPRKSPPWQWKLSLCKDFPDAPKNISNRPPCPKITCSYLKSPLHYHAAGSKKASSPHTLLPACTNGQQIFSESPLQVSTPDCSSNSTIVIL